MFALKRNQVIVTALVVMIAVAGYLNIAESRKTAEVSETAMYHQLPDGTLIPNEDLLEVSSPNIEGEIGIAISTDDDYYFDELVRNAAPTENKNEGVDTKERSDSALNDNPGQAIFVNSSGVSTSEQEYFVTAKLEREQTRAKEKDILTEMIGNQNLSKEDVSMCAAALLDIQKRIEKEAAAEAMIEAKGFKEAYVRIDDETVDVIVSKSALTEAEIAQIEDIVVRKTGFPPDKIRISPLKAAG